MNSKSNIEDFIVNCFKSYGVDTSPIDFKDSIRYSSCSFDLKERKFTLENLEPILMDITLGLKLIVTPIIDPSRLESDSVLTLQIPKPEFALVRALDLLAKIDSKYTFPVIFGVDETNSPVVFELDKVGNILMTGATGSGKSVFAHSMINTLMRRSSPSKLELVLVDMKRVEFSFYKDSKFLYCAPIVDHEKFFTTLEELIAIPSHDHKTIIFIDTFSDLVVAQKERFEKLIFKLLNRRNTHIVMWDSRPSQGVYTQNILSWFPNKILFNTASQRDSLYFAGIKDGVHLLGKGDAIIMGTFLDTPTRVQVPYISDEEILNNLKNI